jgi:very-short-patch-repair endonuclease
MDEARLMDEARRMDKPRPGKRRRYGTVSVPRIVSVAHAHALGIPAHVISRRHATGQWVRLAPGIYLTSPPVSRHDRLIAAALHGGPRSVVSGAAALLHYRFRSPSGAAATLVLVPAQGGARSTSEISIRRTARLPLPVRIEGVPIAPVARAVADHALTLTGLDDVRALVSESIQRRFTTPRAIEAELDAGPRQGSARLRQALGEVSLGARSAPEARAGRALRRAHVAGFVQNARVRAGGRAFVADFLFEAQRAILEIDSAEYHFSRADWARTMERDQQLQAAGYAVLHVRPAQLIADEAGFVRLVVDWLAALERHRP